MSRNLFLAALCLVLASSSRSSDADEMALPADLQAALFKKIFEYDRALVDAPAVSVLVVHDGMSFETAEGLVKAFRETGVNAVTAPVEGLASQITDGSVVYVTDGLDNAAIGELCASRGTLSVSGHPALVESGIVSVGIGVNDKKPEILVHLGRLKEEGHRLAAELLNLARVIR